MLRSVKGEAASEVAPTPSTDRKVVRVKPSAPEQVRYWALPSVDPAPGAPSKGRLAKVLSREAIEKGQPWLSPRMVRQWLDSGGNLGESNGYSVGGTLVLNRLVKQHNIILTKPLSAVARERVAEAFRPASPAVPAQARRTPTTPQKNTHTVPDKPPRDLVPRGALTLTLFCLVVSMLEFLHPGLTIGASGTDWISLGLVSGVVGVLAIIVPGDKD